MKNLDWKKVAIGAGILVLLGIILFFGISFFRNTTQSPIQTTGTFGSENNQGSIQTTNGNTSGTEPTFSNGVGSGSSVIPIFKIADGPVVAGMLFEEGIPTTTTARYITANDGHIIDLSLDVPGAAPRLVSDTTIPGIERAIWARKGQGVIYQYINNGILKSVLLNLPPAATSTNVAPSAVPTAIHFLPDNIIDIAVSPDGNSMVYLLKNTSGRADGFIAKTDGSSGTKLFSLPLSQVVALWPSTNTLLIYSKSAAGVAGIAFSVNVRTGGTTPIVYGLGLTATADPAFSYLLYGTADGTGMGLFDEQIKTATTSSVSLSPSISAVPEQCIWNMATTTLAYCAALIQPPSLDYLDLWHQGQESDVETIVSFNARTSISTTIATPGTKDGGESSDIVGLSVSPDSHYLSFVSKDDGILWGVRLTR